MKWMRLFRYLPLLALLLLAGCAQPGLRTDAGQEKPVEAAEIPLSQQLREAAPEIVSYPVSSEHTLTALVPENYTGEDGSGPFYQALAEATGASVSYTILPEAGYEDGRLMDIIAGGELPDLIWGLNEYLLENMEEELLELDEYIKSSAPNYISRISRDEDTMAAVLPDEGPILQFCTLREDPQPEASYGPVARQDLLDKYGLSPMETYADWETFLKAVKADVPQPLNLSYYAMSQGNWISGGHGVSIGFDSEDRGFYRVEKTVKYGPLEPEYTELITMLRAWYQEGLIGSKFLDFRDFGGSDYLLKQAMGESGIFFLTADHVKSLTAVSELEGFAAVQLPDPVLEPGDETHLGEHRMEPVREQGFSISAECPEPETAVRFVDYLYSDEGIRLCNMGAEGITWTKEKDGPAFTEAALENVSLLEQYTNLHLAGMFSRQWSELERTLSAEETEAWLVRKDTDWHLPFSILDLKARQKLRGEDDLALEQIVELATYASSMTLQLIVGEAPMEDIPAMQEKLREMGAQDCVESLQKQLDAYYAR